MCGLGPGTGGQETVRRRGKKQLKSNTIWCVWEERPRLDLSSGVISAGQTLDHVHIHVIPRWFGNVSDPRGGVRWVLPERSV